MVCFLIKRILMKSIEDNYGNKGEKGELLGEHELKGY